MLGTERHESRRIDNQLRGRSGRQGDPGRSKFFLSLEDDLMRIFGSDKLDGMLQKLGLKEDEAIVHPWINKALEKAQQKVEARNFDIRKNILKFDNVMNDQRKVIFEQRIELMRDEKVAETVADMRHAVIDELVAKHVPENAYPEQWDTPGLKDEVTRCSGSTCRSTTGPRRKASPTRNCSPASSGAPTSTWPPRWRNGDPTSSATSRNRSCCRRSTTSGASTVMLEHLRQVIGLRGYGQRDPLNEYKSEAFHLFETMMQQLREAVTAQLMRVEIVRRRRRRSRQLPYMEAHKVDPFTGEDEMALADAALAPAAPARRGGGAPSATPTIRPAGARSAATKLPVRLRQEVQALPRPLRVSWHADERAEMPVARAPLAGAD